MWRAADARPQLDLLNPVEARAYVSEIRGRVLDVLDRVPLEHGPLVDQGFVYGMVVQHEHQHDETMTATLQLRSTVEYPLVDGAGFAAAGDASPLPAEVRVHRGPRAIATDLAPW